MRFNLRCLSCACAGRARLHELPALSLQMRILLARLRRDFRRRESRLRGRDDVSGRATAKHTDVILGLGPRIQCSAISNLTRERKGFSKRRLASLAALWVLGTSPRMTLGYLGFGSSARTVRSIRRPGEQQQVAIGVFDDESFGAPGLLSQGLKERSTRGLKLEIELLDLVGGIDAHVG
jgi:hypothetical protein